jgi:hypothetical protein
MIAKGPIYGLFFPYLPSLERILMSHDVVLGRFLWRPQLLTRS